MWGGDLLVSIACYLCGIFLPANRGQFREFPDPESSPPTTKAPALGFLLRFHNRLPLTSSHPEGNICGPSVPLQLPGGFGTVDPKEKIATFLSQLGKWQDCPFSLAVVSSQGGMENREGRNLEKSVQKLVLVLESLLCVCFPPTPPTP